MARDEARVVGRKEKNRPRNIDGFAQSPERGFLRPNRCDLIVVKRRFRHARLDGPRFDIIRSNPKFPEIERQCPS